jgi:hypothetical protein
VNGISFTILEDPTVGNVSSVTVCFWVPRSKLETEIASLQVTMRLLNMYLEFKLYCFCLKGLNLASLRQGISTIARSDILSFMSVNIYVVHYTCNKYA